jgi:hypothetical protein
MSDVIDQQAALEGWAMAQVREMARAAGFAEAIALLRDGKDSLHNALHELNVRIGELVGDCHCNLVAEVTLDALTAHLAAHRPTPTTEETT